MNTPYLTSEDVVSGSAELASPLLPSETKALLSESDIIATSTRGSCGVNPGPVPVLLRIISFFVSSIGDLLYGVRNRLMLSPSLPVMFSTAAMLRFKVLAVRGGGTDPTLMRPREGSLGVTGILEGIAPSSA